MIYYVLPLSDRAQPALARVEVTRETLRNFAIDPEQTVYLLGHLSFYHDGRCLNRKDGFDGFVLYGSLDKALAALHARQLAQADQHHRDADRALAQEQVALEHTWRIAEIQAKLRTGLITEEELVLRNRLERRAKVLAWQAKDAPFPPDVPAL